VLTFDKLKIVTSIEHIKILDENAFNIELKNNVISSLKFHQEVPFSLYIEVDYGADELVLEFTGKVLGNEYPKLISMDTIKQCFSNINNMGICSLDIDAIMENAEVVKCDVTQDVCCSDISALTAFISSNVTNYKEYIARPLRNGNFVVEKNVTTRGYKKRLTIYNKQKEMNKQENIRYMTEYTIPTNTFDNVCRFEINLNSTAQIRKALGISDTSLQSVLTATKNPIRDFLDDVVAESDYTIPLTDKQSYITALVLKDCDYDIHKVEVKMRQLYAKGTNLTKVMRPYREALNRMSEHQFTKKDLLNMLS
jgi:hypothetical protein